MKPRSLLLLALALTLSGTCRTRAPAHVSPRFAECWLATYLDGRQVGYAMYRYHRTNQSYVFEGLMRLAVSMMGSSQRVRVWSRTIANSDLTLRSFELEMGSQDNAYRARGEVCGNELVVSDSRGGGARRIRLDGKVFPLDALG
ncbi:MAG: hypothetical protein ABIK43_05575, partial [candidate division WOR-3 bacterium]